MSIRGPLPSVDDNHVLQTRSLAVLRYVLPADTLIFRDERTDDFGVDGSLELILNGQATNIRAQVQLKGRSKTVANKDGSVSISIETANLNHLLNGTYPLYVLFRPEHEELRVVRARDEQARLADENPSWLDQESVSVRFHDLLTPATIAQLIEEMIEEARLRRALDEQLRGLRTRGGGIVLVDAATRQVADTETLLATLAEAGQTMTNAGHGKIVVEWGRLIPASLLTAQPRSALALAYAQLHLGNYFDAAATLRSLALSKTHMDTESQAWLSVLLISVRRALGQTTPDQYEIEMDQWAKTGLNGLVAQYRVSRAWSAYTRTLNVLLADEERNTAKSAARAALAEAAPFADEHVGLYLRLLEMTLRLHDISDALLAARALADLARIGIGDPQNAQQLARAATEQSSQWLTALSEIAERTKATDPSAYCETMLLMGYAALDRERQRHYDAWRRGVQSPLPRTELLAAARETLMLARRLESRDLELRALFDLAQFLDTCDQPAEATSVAKEALAIAELVGSDVHLRHAKAFLGGNDRWEMRRQQAMKLASTSEEEMLRDAPDEQVSFMAKTLGAAKLLAPEQVPNLAHSLMCQRQLARERRDWCKHMRLAEYVPARPEDRYAAFPLLKIVCAKRGLEQLVETEQVPSITRSFREDHCRGCSFRDTAAGSGATRPSPGAHKKERVTRKRTKKRKQQRKSGS